MKKCILLGVITLLIISVNAQSKFDVKDFGCFKLHSYVTANPLGDISYTISDLTGIYAENKI